MKLAALILTFITTISAYSQAPRESEVITLKEHEAIFTDLKQADIFEDLADKAKQKVVDAEVKARGEELGSFLGNLGYQVRNAYAKSYEKRTGTPAGEGIWFIPTKSEFETTAEYEGRIDAKTKEMFKKQQLADVEAAALKTKAQAFSTASHNKTDGLNVFTALTKLEMGKYDAENKTAKFTAMITSLGTYDGRVAAIYVNGDLPAIEIPVELAKRLRGASDQGGLFCIMKFGLPKLQLVHGPIELPETKGESLTKLGLGLAIIAAGSEVFGMVPACRNIYLPSYSNKALYC